MKKNRIEILESLVKEELKNRVGAHDFDHFIRVKKNAIKILEQEGGDEELVLAIALTHDIVRPETIKEDITYLEMAVSKAQNLLKKASYPEDMISKICDGIRTHSMPTSKENPIGKPQRLEEKIAFDADKIDGVGHIGIARWFMVLGKNNVSIDKAAKLYLYTIERYEKEVGTLYTKTGQDMVINKVIYTKEFLREIIEELRSYKENNIEDGHIKV